MLKLTKSAAEKIKQLLTERKYIGVRVGVQGGGCSGFQYKLEFEESNSSSDRTIESHGVKLFIDTKSLLYLAGTEIDYVDTLAGSGFKFVNPSAKRTCGCGESFSI